MDEYIKKDTIIEIFNAKADMAIGTPKIVFLSAAKMIEKLPDADVEVIRHGKWIRERYIDAVTSDYKCSVCDFDDTLYDNLVEKFYKYCPYCGAEMDLE